MRRFERVPHIRFEGKRRIITKMIALSLAFAVLLVAVFIIIKIFKLLLNLRG
jgi:hypothetical protein